MAFELDIGCDHACCPCDPPTVTCELIDDSPKTYQYTITDATSAWYIKRCFDISGNATDTEVTIDPPVSGTITAEENCIYIVYAENACGEANDTCSDMTTGCFPCASSLGELLYGVMIIKDIPNNLPANCALGFGFQRAEWENFGDWNGTVIWDASQLAPTGLTFFQMGAGRFRADTGNPWTDVAYGVAAQCAAGGVFGTSGRPVFQAGTTVLTGTSGASGASWAVTGLTAAGRCNYISAATNSGARATYSTCPFNGGFAVAPEALPLAFSNIITWDVTEFS